MLVGLQRRVGSAKLAGENPARTPLNYKEAKKWRNVREEITFFSVLASGSLDGSRAIVLVTGSLSSGQANRYRSCNTGSSEKRGRRWKHRLAGDLGPSVSVLLWVDSPLFGGWDTLWRDAP